MPLTIGYARTDQLETIIEIELDADARYADSSHPEIAGEHIPLDDLAAAIAARQVIVATENDVVVGWLLVTKVGEEACIGQISVRRSAGNRGVGTRLLTTMLDSLRASGYTSVVLNTQSDVAWNRPWYERLGFVVVSPEEWTEGMHDVTKAQSADGLDWSTRVHMRLQLVDEPG